MQKIIRNRIRCTHCGDIIERETVHDYLRRGYLNNSDDYEELSDVEVKEDE